MTKENNENLITWSDFEMVELRTGTVIAVDDYPEARRPAYKITVDFGEKIGKYKHIICGRQYDFTSYRNNFRN